MIITTSKEMRPRDSADFYPTPLEVCHAAINLIPRHYAPMKILDPGAGTGVWGLAAAKRWGFARIHGVEIRETNPVVGVYSDWHAGSFLPLVPPKEPKRTGDPAKDERLAEQYRFDLWASQQPVCGLEGHFYDLVIGNPPYKYAEPFVRRALDRTRTHGYVVFLLRLAFLEGRDRSKGLWQEYPPQTVAVCGARPSFTGNGKTDATAYAVFVWQKDWHGTPALTWL